MTASNELVGQVLSVHVGPIAPLGPKGVPSGFVKHAVAGPVSVHPLGLQGDTQADLSVHGGLEKAVYAYSVANYELWSSEYPQHAAKFVPGGVGENLAVLGQTEATVCIGDAFLIGSVILQVCQPRQPCFKFALRFEDNQLPRAMVLNGRSGWYYRVLQPGTLTAGDPIALLKRPNPTWPISRFVMHQRFSPEEQAELAELPGLASAWQSAAQSSLRNLGNYG
jgi:MOSC domain-containing protein YiiM